MKKLLIAAFLVLSMSVHAGMDSRGNPVPDTSIKRTTEPRPMQAGQMSEKEDDHSGLKLLVETVIIIKRNYYKEVDERKLAEKLLEGGLPAFDKFCHYANPEQQKLEKENATGHFSGIGAVIDQDETGDAPVLNIMSVMEGSPAEKAGLQSGDHVLAIATNGTDKDSVRTDKMSIADAVKLIRGQADTVVYLLIERKGKLIDFRITRGDIKEKIVSGKMMSPDVGYLRLTGFHGEDTLDEFETLVSSMQARGAKTLILDLRNNPGGFVEQAVTIIGWFKKGFMNSVLITMQYRDHKEVLRQFGPGKFQDLPVVVLVNKGSASASEMVTAYLKNYNGAVVVGMTTYGKGVGQSVIDHVISGGRLVITSFEYMVGPNNVRLHEIGVHPTIEVKQDKPAKTEAEDAQLQRGLLEAEKLAK